MADKIEYRTRGERKTGSRIGERLAEKLNTSANAGAQPQTLEELRAAVKANKATPVLSAEGPDADRVLKPSISKSPFIALVMLGVVGAVVLSIVFCGWYTLVRSPVPAVDPGQEVAVIIPEGAGIAEIADILVERGIVKNPLMFQIMARLKGGGTFFHAGRYLLITGSGYEAAIAALSVTPEPAEVVRITIIEGLRIDQVARSVADQLGISPTEFEERAKTAAPDYVDKYPYLAGAYGDSLEGFLFPDTYDFTTDSTVDDVIERQLARFDEIWKSLDVEASRLEAHSVVELVTIASLAEREARLDDERPLVTSVIDNRLAEGMMLQFCSTVQFLLPPERLTDLRLSDEDTRISSPYNTYINEGLPPGPICNPSKASLEAAVRPAKTEYLYFALTGTDGSQTFSKTYEEHQEALRISYEVFGQ